MDASTLSIGTFGQSVAALQKSLQRLGYEIPPSEMQRTFFGPVTRQAVMQFQKESGLGASGKVDPRTAAAVNAALSSTETAGPPSGPVTRALAGPAAPLAQRPAAPTPAPSGPARKGATSDTTIVGIPASTASQKRTMTGASPAAGGAVRPSPASQKPPIVKASAVPKQVAARAVGVAKATAINISGANLDRPVVAVLTDKAVTPATKSALSDSLNAALKSQLADAANKAGYTGLANALQATRPVDLTAAGALSLRDFVRRNVALPADPAQRTAIEADIGKLSSATTVGDLLGLNSSVQANLILAPVLKQARLATLLQTSPVLRSNGALIDNFVAQYADFTGPIAQFWTSLQQQAAFKAAVPELQLTLQLDALSLDNPALVLALRKQYPQMTAPSDLTTMSAPDWQRFITEQKIALPASIVRDTPTDQVANYAAKIVGILQEAYPGSYFVRDLQTGLAGSQNPVDRGVATFLGNAVDFDILNTNLRTYIAQNQATAFEGIVAAQLTAVTRRVATWQRVARMAPDYATANTLLTNGFSSAYAIASTPRASFITRLAGPLGTSAQAASIYSKAQQIVAGSAGLISNVRQALSMKTARTIGDVAGSVAGLLGIGAASANSGTGSPADGGTPVNGSSGTTPPPTPISGLADWQTLFGSTSFCACSDCRSAYSAAAYFVDLMQFLQTAGANPVSGLTPYHVLISRRPDLPFIKLNCENTDTELPYVDLVNEILEGFVVINNGKLDRSVAHDTPKDATAAELSVNPEYTNENAYNKFLYTAVYPPTLPFDRWLETARIYLQFAGSSLWEVMATCQKGAAPSIYTAPLAALPAISLPAFVIYDGVQKQLTTVGRLTPASLDDLLALSQDGNYQAAINTLYMASQADLLKGSPADIALACEFLNISDVECAILTKKSFPGSSPMPPWTLADFYGDPLNITGIWEASLFFVPAFLQITQIAYDDLVELLKTRFLNPNQTIFLQAQDPNNPCDLASTVIVDTSAQDQILQDATLDFMHRFIRLWKKLGWKISELDKTITALRATDVDQAFLVSLAAVKQLQASLKLPLLQVLSFWAGLDTDGLDSLYLMLFQNKAVSKPLDPAFQLKYFAKLAEWPQLEFPSPLFPNLIYDASAAFLYQTTIIGPDEINQLNVVSTDSGYLATIQMIQSQGGLSVVGGFPLADLPPAALPSIVLPDFISWQPPIGSVAVTGLTMAVPMSADQQVLLLTLSPDPSFQAAVNMLYATSNSGSAAPYNQALAALPTVTGLAYSAGAQQVSYIGAMPDNVRAQFNFCNDPIYQTAIDDLYLRRTLSATELIGSASGPGISDHIPPILAALQLTAQDLAAIRSYAGLADPPLPQPSTPLTLANLSILARYAFLAQALALPVTDLIAAIQLLSTDPFERRDPVSTLEFVQAVQAIMASSFSIAQLNYLYRHDFDPNAGIAPLPADVNLLLTTLQAGLAAIAHADVVAPDPKGDLLVKNLGTLLGASIAGLALGLINGTGIYSSPLAALPAITGFPPVLPITLPAFVTYSAGNLGLNTPGPMTAAQLSKLLDLSTDPAYQAAVNGLSTMSQSGPGPFNVPLTALPMIPFTAVSYDGAAQALRIAGPMSTVIQTSLLALSSDTSYQAAVQNLRQQEIAFINAYFPPFLDASDAITQLIENPQGLTTAEKIAYVTQHLMPYLRQVQSESLVTQTLCDNLGLSSQVSGLLLNTVLESQISPNSPALAMADFLALVGDGLTASYYGTIDLTGVPVLTRIDQTVDFNWGFGLPDATVAARPFSVKWTGWVMPQYSDSYTFYVRAGGGFRLWINDPTTPLIDAWTDQPPTEFSKVLLTPLAAGTLYWVTLEYFDNTASAEIELSWSGPSTPKTVIPQTQLFSGAAIQALTPVINSYILLYKMSLLVTGFQLTPSDVAYLCQHGADFSGADPNDSSKSANFDPNLLPLALTTSSHYSGTLFNQWQRLNAVMGLRKRFPGGDAGLLQIFGTASATGAPATQLSSTDPFTATIVEVTGWNVTDLVFMAGSGGFGLTYADFTNERGADGTGLVRLQACAAVVTRLGISAQQLFSWAIFGSDAPSEEAIAQDVQQTFKARYDDATWITVGKPLNDKVREESKQALIAYILGKANVWNLSAPDDGTVITTSDQLYEFFLIDVEMSTCMLTSRIVQASAAIQLFVERCLMNLEQVSGVSPSVFDTTYWETIKNFRVWQAAKLVFFYPEDYMMPELRDDKTPFFEDLESALLQNTITADTVEQAYLAYLTALNNVALLDVRATYWQLDPNSTPASDGTPDATNDVLHVFARTTVTPYVYYYRRLLNCSQYGVGSGAVWTPWELVDLDIQGDRLIPVVWDRRLYLFWTSFSQTSDPSSPATINLPSASQQTYILQAPQLDLQVSISWSEYRQGAWSSKSSSPTFKTSGYLLGSNPDGSLDTSPFFVTSEIDADDSLAIYIYTPPVDPYTGYKYATELCHFTLSGCGSVPAFFPSENDSLTNDPLWSVPVSLPVEAYFFCNSIVETASELWLSPDSQGVDNPLSVQVLGSSSSSYNPNALWPYNPYNLVFPQQFYPDANLSMPSPFSSLGGSKPYFYQDSRRLYYVTGRSIPTALQVSSVNVESQYYSRLGLTQASPQNSPYIVFPRDNSATAGRTPTGNAATTVARQITRTPLPADVTSRSNVGAAAEMLDAPAQVAPTPNFLFRAFFHPLACSFIKTVNRYGLPKLLTLSTQALTNDNDGQAGGGVLSGFMISHDPSGSEAVSLSPGILVTQDATGEAHFFETIGTTSVPPPPGAPSNLYYNPQSGFYYGQTPLVGGDAFIGSFVYPFAPPWLGSGPTVFERVYEPRSSCVDPATYPRENIDFSFDGAYAIYNWELFFHIPLLIATRLSQNQQFQDSENWFRYMFNPTSSSSDPIPQRYWTCLPFYECSPWDEIAGQIQNLLYPTASGGTGEPGSLCGQDISDQITAWMSDPFNPFMIGRMRTVAFRMKVVMAYLDNLIAWGDSLFGQNTRESINEATQLYVRAKEILGPRPIEIPQRGTIQDYSYNDLLMLFGVSEDNLNNPLVLIENDFPYISGPGTIAATGLSFALSMSSFVPYFCLPANDTLLAYWNTVDDRLYKIRHCMNIQGVIEQLPLFAPPISPTLLVAAEAAGVDLSSVIANTNAATGFYRFNILIQKALELCSEVRSLGASLLAVLEKGDAEALELLRATQETSLLNAMQQMKLYAVQEAQNTAEGYAAAYQMARDRQVWYQNLSSVGLISPELAQSAALASASGFQNDAISSLGNIPFDLMIPDFGFGLSGFGGSPVATISGTIGGHVLSELDNSSAASSQANAGYQSTLSSSAGLQAQWFRRSQDWQLQAQQATDEMAQIQAQLAAANFGVQVAQEDQKNLSLQIQNAQAVQDFLTGRYTNQQLYSWMVDQISTVFFQCYQMAYDFATRAEAAFRFERCLTTSSYIQFGYWDSLKKGLLSGERLFADLKRLEIAYLDTDVREYEISKSVSLVLVDPWALINLKETGQCQLNLPEAFFNMDYPGHYFRRLKTVSLTIPSVPGPYTSVNCTLTLLNSKIRVDSAASSPTDYNSDAHFITNYAATQSIATSTAQNDSGLFEVNFHDERYLPFEGAGLISTWQIDMPLDCNAFDFGSISDLIINLRYTARYGGDQLRDMARQAAVLSPRPTQSSSSQVAFANKQTNLQRLFSLRHEYQSEWYKFLNPPADTVNPSMQIALDRVRFPWQYRSTKTLTISKVEVVLLFKSPQYQQGGLALTIGSPGAPSPAAVSLTSNQALLNGAGYGVLSNPAQPKSSGQGAPASWILTATTIPTGLEPLDATGTPIPSRLNPHAIADILLLCAYSVSW